MIIKKIYKLFIKDTSYELAEEEVNALYQTCRKVLNINSNNTNPLTPSTLPWPTYPWTDTGNSLIWPSSDNYNKNSVNNYSTTYSDVDMSKIKSSYSGFNLTSDDMETIKDNNKWKQACDKLNVTTTSEGIKVG